MVISKKAVAEVTFGATDSEYIEIFEQLNGRFNIPDPDDARFHFARDLARHSPTEVDGHAHSDSALPIHDLYWDDLTRKP